MRNFDFMKILGLCLLLANNMWLSAQFVVVNNKIGEPNNKVHHQLNFNQGNYSEAVNENGRQVYVHNDLYPAIENGINNISTTVELIYDAEIYTPSPSGVMVLNEETGHVQTITQIWENSIEIAVPDEGYYDFITSFDRIDGEKGTYWIIKESVFVEESTTVQINPTEAVNFIKSDIVNETGELLRPGVWSEWDSMCLGGNSDVSVDQVFYFKPLEMAVNTTSYQWTCRGEENEEPGWNFYINNVSERYHYMANIIGGGYNANSYVLKAPVLKGVSASHEFINDPQEYVLHSEKFKPTVLGSNNPYVFPAFTAISVLNGELIHSSQFSIVESGFNVEEDGVKLFLNNPVRIDDPLNVLASAGVYDNFQFINPMVSIPTYIKGNTIVLTENGELQYGSGHCGWSLYFANQQPQTPPEGKEGLFPFHPKFSYTLAENTNNIQGNNVPINRALFYNGAIKLQYKGRYGEVRESDLFNTQFDVQQDGNNVYSGDILGFSLVPLPTSGEVSITLNNINVEVDDIAGKNTTKISYNASQDDAPPTLQMLQFRGTDGKVTDHFENSAKGTIRIAAGDFQYNPATNGMDYKEGNEVEFYYVPNGQEEWIELELTEDPENFFVPAFGDYYEASLESVVVPEDNTWFDVRIICTDAAGNKQEQIVSPAFKIEQATMGIDEMEKSDFSVYPNPFTNEVNIQLPENVKGSYTFKVADLTGKMVYNQSQDKKSFVWNGSSLPKGVYILSIESNGKVIAKKVIKK